MTKWKEIFNYFFTFMTVNSSRNNFSNFFVRIHFESFQFFLEDEKRKNIKNVLDRIFQLIHFYHSWKFGENPSVQKLLRGNALNFLNVFAWLSKWFMSDAEILLWQKLANIPWLIVYSDIESHNLWCFLLGM